MPSNNKDNPFKADALQPSNKTKEGYQQAVKLYNEKFAPNNGFKQFNEIDVAYLNAESEDDGHLTVFHLFRRFGSFSDKRRQTTFPIFEVVYR